MAPIANAWTLKQAWPGAELVVVDDEGHSGNQRGIEGQLIRATDRFAL
jgi:proline iminopeptidase